MFNQLNGNDIILFTFEVIRFRLERRLFNQVFYIRLDIIISKMLRFRNVIVAIRYRYTTHTQKSVSRVGRG